MSPSKLVQYTLLRLDNFSSGDNLTIIFHSFITSFIKQTELNFISNFSTRCFEWHAEHKLLEEIRGLRNQHLQIVCRIPFGFSFLLTAMTPPIIMMRARIVLIWRRPSQCIWRGIQWFSMQKGSSQLPCSMCLVPLRGNSLLRWQVTGRQQSRWQWNLQQDHLLGR